MNKLIFQLYRFLPKKIIRKLGESKLLKPLRDLALRQKNGVKTITVTVNRKYPPFEVFFKYVAGLKDAAQAYERGVENSLLLSTIKILQSKGITEKAIIMDVGANFGYLSMVWSQSLAANGGKVYSFEPNKKVFEILLQTVNLNETDDKVISPLNLAVGSKSGIIELHDFGNSSSTIKDEKKTISSYPVSIVSIDDFVQSKFIEKVDLVKIDVDGIEFDILQGARNTLISFKPVLVIETNNDKRIIDFCQGLGYLVLDMNLSIYKNTDEIPVNIFCI
jgi:hypothetical protein